mmetsp:Transcript_21094/g.28344  ORF Transcript_21094/g.28344 Transcript_21094/m.28344 type:complete len:114 (-) Transcript_21094:666-1007(-)
MEWPDYEVTSVALSNYLAYGVFGLCASIPILLFILACCKKAKLADESFALKYGAFVDGMKSDDPDSANAVLFLALLYFCRRMASCITLVFWQEFFWGQVAIELNVSVLFVILI